MKHLVEISRWIVGPLFIFSGLIKLNDPVGTEIKLEEYFDLFATDFASFFEIFIPASLFLSVFLAVLEILLGIALIWKYRMKWTSWILLVLIIFFTFLTFYSAYFNKVTDCGCFGDAINLTPWESFSKDMVLVVLIGILFYFRKFFVQPNSPSTDLRMGALALLFSVAGIHAINHLPYIDFRSYAAGQSIPQNMMPEEDPVFEYTFQKDGETITSRQYLAEKDGYKYLSHQVINEDKTQPKITDYNVWNNDGDFTEASLSEKKLFVIFHDVKKSDRGSIGKINRLVQNLGGNQVEPMVLTSSDEPTYDIFRHEFQLAIPYFFTDATVLKTIIRSDPGLVLLNDGVVLGKWHFNDVPNISEINQLLL